ncbi:interferon-induced very large GTPase 1-like [Lethenteron reissneri]|uniref:interferon-induced very large GTPase 1-like n=1 Tax=Lethenteron reissneri TaxID=7753 RepID=UPI002AB67161|nr:interferon-induced very large GTPase 1-like [Lethenteron reissneri]
MAATVVCDICGDGHTPAVKTCMRCEISYCLSHFRPHVENSRLRDHAVVDLTASLEQRGCREHRQELKFYCEQDESLVCIVCLNAGDHIEHRVVAVETAQRTKQTSKAIPIEQVAGLCVAEEPRVTAARPRIIYKEQCKTKLQSSTEHSANSTSNKLAPKTSVPVPEFYHSIYGKSLPFITPSDYVKIIEIIKKPKANANQALAIVNMLLPYIMQVIKMWGVSILHPVNISELASDNMETCRSSQSCKSPTFAKRSSKAAASSLASQTRALNKVPLSRLDCLVALLSSADCTVVQDLIQILSKFPVALPLVMPNLEKKGEYKVMLPLLTGNTVKWEVQSGVIIENNIFTNPFVLILAVRLGNSTCGKSTILNQLMAVENMFSSCGEPGARRGRPLTLDGTVEFTWLTKETCGAGLWNSVLQQFYARGGSEVVLLANLHGDASEYPEVIQFFKNLASTYVVFMMPEKGELQEEKWKKFVQCSGSRENIHYLMVDPDEDCNEPEESVIQTTRLTNDDTLQKVRALLKNALTSVAPKMITVSNPDMSKIGKTLQVIEGVCCNPSQNVIKFIIEKTCQETRNYMQFQIRNSVERNSNELWEGNEVLQTLIHLYVEVLRLPLSERLKAMAHLEQSISQLSNSESSKLRQIVIADKEELERQILLNGQNKLTINKMKEHINTNMKKLDNKSLGPEHFFRELGHIYELTNEGQRESGALFECPTSYAELLMSGHAIELLNGDTGEMPGAWLTAICNHVTKAFPNLRIFVLSILGLQSSGKSTLLNALFACKFAVSVGRCTRGLFMRLLFLEEKLSERLNADAILLIDTEGLGAPEKMNDDDAEKRDRMLATFAMSVSNLTIINILGEYMRELTEILQIAIVAMARLEMAKMSPDIFMVQHLTERNTSKTSSGHEQFCKALQKALEFTKEKDVDMELLDVNCLTNLADRIKKGELLKQFRPFKNGASAGAPPSEEYHNDVVDLYKTILNACQKSENKIPFRDWHSLVQSYWNCVSHENFIVRFKNIKEMYEFIDHGQRIARLKERIDGAFFVHVEAMRRQIRAAVTHWTPEEQPRMCELLLKGFKKELNAVPINCQKDNSNNLGCGKCTEVITETSILDNYVTEKECGPEIMDTIDAYTKQVRQSALITLTQILDATVVRHGCSLEFMEEITRSLNDALSQSPAGQFTVPERKTQVNKIWASLVEITKSKERSAPDCDKMAEEISKEYSMTQMCISGGFEELQLHCLGELEAYQKSKLYYLVRNQTKMSGDEISWLKNELDKIPKSILHDKEAEHFETGMIRSLKIRVDNILQQFEKHFKKKFIIKFRSNFHLYTLQKFGHLMSMCQKEWEKKHSPTSILHQRKEELKSLIDLRLQHGFTSASEGRIISKYLLEAIKQKSLKAGNSEKVQAVLDLQWTTNSEKVRLRYFEQFASQVNNGKKEEALKHFEDPKQAINKWFTQTINHHARSKETTQCKKTFKSEFQRVLQKVGSCSDVREVITFTQRYLTDVENVEYKSGIENQKIAQGDLEILKDSIQRGLNESESTVDCTQLMFTDPSTDETVMRRLGCTEKCFWCGALCWGSRGHDNNADETRKHHTCHQPRGLGYTNYKNTTNLVARPCHLTSDDTTVIWGNNEMKWSAAKQTEFSHWKFDAHCNNKFDELMRWFFQELHKDIAESIKLLPALEDELKMYKCENLHLAPILSTIRELIK